MAPLQPERNTSVRTRILGFVALFIFAMFFLVQANPALSKGVARLTAKFFVMYCTRQTDNAACYERTVPRLLYVSPISDVFSVVREIQTQDPSYRFCHVLGHQLGVLEVQRDPDHWMDLMHNNPPDGLCSNGYIHGVIVQKFSETVFTPTQIDAIVPDLSKACEPSAGWNPTDLDKAMCYHGMGHVLTHMTDANMPLAVSYCKVISIHGYEDYSRPCISGVFMQIFQPLEPEDYALIARLPVKPTKDTLATFCGAYDTEEERSACLGEGWPLYREELQTAEGIKKFCTTSPVASTQKNCFTTVFSIGARGSLSDPTKQEKLCTSMPQQYQSECVGILAEAFVEEDRTQVVSATAVCSRAPDRLKDSCYEYLLARAEFTFGDGAATQEALCKALPPSWAGRCEAGERPPIQ